jgi:predicted RNase H-like HicB family nuclease
MKKTAYPIVVTLTDDKKMPYSAYIPDFDRYTQGLDMADVLCQAQDLIALAGIDLQDEGKKIPSPSLLDDVITKSGQEKALVIIDFDTYRARHENRTVRKNVTIPSWLNAQAQDARLNFSATLKNALKEKLNVR